MERGELMAAPVQTVIYRLDEAHKPVWQFHSMPESAVGGGDTLDEAREQYRDALEFLLDTDQLPEIREYVEREAHLGIWVRTLMADERGEALVQEIGRQVSFYPKQDLDWFHNNPTAGGDPVVFHGGRDDPLSSIFEQMTPFDSLILVAGLGQGGPKPTKLMWLVIAGAEATFDRRDEPPMDMGDVGLTPDSTLNEVFADALRHHRLHGDLSPNKLPGPALLVPV